MLITYLPMLMAYEHKRLFRRTPGTDVANAAGKEGTKVADNVNPGFFSKAATWAKTPWGMGILGTGALASAGAAYLYNKNRNQGTSGMPPGQPAAGLQASGQPATGQPATDPTAQASLSQPIGATAGSTSTTTSGTTVGTSGTPAIQSSQAPLGTPAAQQYVSGKSDSFKPPPIQ